jgi:hypothetical protein
LRVPNLIRWAFSFFTQALAEFGIPVEVNWTQMGTAIAGTSKIVPVVARRAHLRPFAQAHAFLPVPVLVIRANHGLIAPALAGNLVPDLIFGANVTPWAFAGARIEAEVERWPAFNMLMTIAFACCGVPVPWIVACGVVNTLARLN